MRSLGLAGVGFGGLTEIGGSGMSAHAVRRVNGLAGLVILGVLGVIQVHHLASWAMVS